MRHGSSAKSSLVVFSFVVTALRGAAALGVLLLATGTAPQVAAQGANQGADEWRIRQLMQDINELERAVREQARRIDQLERALAFRGGPGSPPTPDGAPAVLPANNLWLSPARWDRVEPGMTEQQVIDALGYPTSVRTEADGSTKTLFYTVQVGPSGFLSGRVVIAGERVRDVERPTLK